MSVSTPLTKLLGIQHPILLAGMNVASGPDLVAAVSNAGGMGVMGGLGMKPEYMKEQIADIKSQLNSPDLPFGVDLAIPQIGGSARKTNHDYSHGQLDEIVDEIIKGGAKLFVSAVGIPPKPVVERLHAAGIPVMNMVGHPKHVKKCLDVGVDIVCCQGSEGGGHTGDVPTFLLIPAVVDEVKGRKSPLTGEQVLVVAAGGIYDGRGLATSLTMGASGVWVGTRFVAAEEAGAPKAHQDALTTAGWEDTTTTLVVSGRPLRLRKTPYIEKWHAQPEKIKELTDKGIVPIMTEENFEDIGGIHLMGRVAALINEVQPAKQIVDEMMAGAVEALKRGQSYAGAKL